MDIEESQQNKSSSANTGEHQLKYKSAAGYLKENTCTVIAGPCAVENAEQMEKTALYLKKKGVKYMRWGAFKPRTSPYSFQGLKEDGLKILRETGKHHGLTTVSEAIDKESLKLALKYVDIVQIGERNMQNFALLEAVGKEQIPVILKRGHAATIDEWLFAAEYILNGGNNKIILCERGIRTFETDMRYTLDIGAISVVKSRTGLSVIIDPSHAAGAGEYVPALAMAAVAAEADGIMVEIHPTPAEALSDGMQALKLEEFGALYDNMAKVANALGKALI